MNSTRRTLAALVHSGTARTVAPSGSLQLERRIGNRAGTGTIAPYAWHTASGQTCSARLDFPA